MHIPDEALVDPMVLERFRRKYSTEPLIERYIELYGKPVVTERDWQLFTEWYLREPLLKDRRMD